MPPVAPYNADSLANAQAFEPNADADYTMTANHPADAADPLPKSAVSSYHAAAVARTFFETCEGREKFAVGTMLFVENEKSNMQGLFAIPINAELVNKPVIHRMSMMRFVANRIVRVNSLLT